MTRRRSALCADESFRATAEQALATGASFEVDGYPVRVNPPKGTRSTWRVLFYAPDRREYSGGATIDTLYAAVVDAVERSQRELRPQAHRTLSEAREDYLDQHYAGGWDRRTRRDRRNDLNGLVAVCGALPCSDLELAHLREGIQKASTHGRGAFLIKRYRHFLAWGTRHDYFTREQLAAVDTLEWRAPAGYRKAPTRRQQAQSAGTDRAGTSRGFVPAHGQVTDWARRAAVYDAHGEALIHVDAVTGLRFGELMALTADAAVVAKGLGNLVDLEAGLLHIDWQVSECQGRTVELPKADRQRSVVIPRTEKTPTGFDVRGWLARRTPAALAEQRAGTNPHALIFPALRGGSWWHSNLRQRVLLPATRDLGWPVTEATDARGRTRRLSRFTLH